MPDSTQYGRTDELGLKNAAIFFFFQNSLKYFTKDTDMIINKLNYNDVFSL